MSQKNFSEILILCVLCGSLINVMAWLWVIDFAIWCDSTTIYIPIFAWGRTIYDKGDAINIGYWMISVGIIFVAVSAYEFGKLQSE